MILYPVKLEQKTTTSTPLWLKVSKSSQTGKNKKTKSRRTREDIKEEKPSKKKAIKEKIT
ncbi:MAG: hypothetical protein PUE94_01300 [Lachnospiraceae bacterium]|nr:hypothetical protein [Lachnospiraceae bacterium]